MKMPKLCRHRGTGQGYVLLHGDRHYLGKYGDPQTERKYKRLLAEWLQNGRELRVQPDELLVCELLDRFLTHAKSYYANPDGKPGKEYANYKLAIKHVKAVYESTRVAEFGPLALKAVRQTLIDKGCSRKYINSQIDRIKRIFRWGVSEELIPCSVFDALHKVAGLRWGKCAAREGEPVKAVSMECVGAVKGVVAKQVSDLIALQIFTGARAGELVGMRAVDLDTSGKVWLLRPERHKNAHRQHERTIYLGPKAQDIVRPYLVNRAIDKPLFSPREAMYEKWAECETHRNAPSAPAKTKRRIRDAYDVASYGRAIARACNVLKIPRWHCHQLRHTAATFLRKEFGVELARIVLGHKSAQMTLLYAETDAAKAIEAIAKVG